jgi:hypothetical protein
MPKIAFTYASPSDWLKWDEDGFYSPENGILAANSGALLSGTVLAKNAGGKLVPFDAAGVAPLNAAIGILYLDAANSTADLRVAYIINHCVVADKALRFKVGTTDPQKTAAYAALALQGIKVRQGV